MQFNHDDTADICYKLQVDNMIYIVVHNNNWWYCRIHKNATSVLDYSH